MNLLQTIPSNSPSAHWGALTPQELAASLGEDWRCVRLALDTHDGDQVTLLHSDGRTATVTVKNERVNFSVGAQTWTMSAARLIGQGRQYMVVAHEMATMTVHPVVARRPLDAARSVQEWAASMAEISSQQLELEGFEGGASATFAPANDVPLCFQVFEGVEGGRPDPLLTVLLNDALPNPIEVREIDVEQMMRALSYLHSIGHAAKAGADQLQGEYRRLEPLISGLFAELGWQELTQEAA